MAITPLNESYAISATYQGENVQCAVSADGAVGKAFVPLVLKLFLCLMQHLLTFPVLFLKVLKLRRTTKGERTTQSSN